MDTDEDPQEMQFPPIIPEHSKLEAWLIRAERSPAFRAAKVLEGWLGILSLSIAFAALYLTLDGIQIASDQRDQDRQWRTEDAESRRLNSLALAQQLLNDQRNPNAHPGALSLLLGSASHRELNGIALPNLNFERAKLIAPPGSIEHFRRANFCTANFSGAELNGVEFPLSLLAEGKFVSSSISDVSFEQAVLVYADFAKSRLDNVNFTNASLIGARFSSTGLVNVRMDGADLRAVEFTDKNVGYIDLADGSLLGAVDRGSSDAAFSVSMRFANLKGANLSTLSALESSALAGACIDSKTLLPPQLETLRTALSNNPCRGREDVMLLLIAQKDQKSAWQILSDRYNRLSECRNADYWFPDLIRPNQEIRR